MISLCISIKYMSVTVQIGNLLHVDQLAKAVKDSKCCNRILYVGGPLFSELELTPIPGKWHGGLTAGCHLSDKV